MATDPILEEVWRIRDEYAAQFDYDIARMAEDLRKRQEESRKAGWTIVSRTPRFIQQEEDRRKAS